jgi:hypothetical protein
LDTNIARDSTSFYQSITTKQKNPNKKKNQNTTKYQYMETENPNLSSPPNNSNGSTTSDLLLSSPSSQIKTETTPPPSHSFDMNMTMNMNIMNTGQSSPPPENLQPHAKKLRIDSGDMSFGFNNEAFADHQLLIRVEGREYEQPTVVYVSKLLIAGKSVYFRENIGISPSTTIVLQPQHNIKHFVDIIKWMYVDCFDTAGIELLDVMTLAYKFKVKAAIARCASELIANFMTGANASKYIENEIMMRRECANTDDTEFGGFVQLWTQAKQFLRDKFRNFEMEVWTSKDFTEMNVEGLKVVLSSNDLRIGTENTVFAAYRQWIHTNFEDRKYYAALLLPLIRFPLLQHNYLLDVVRTEADLDYPEDAKKTFAKQIIDAYVYHCCSADRREALKECEVPKRTIVPELLSTKFYWKLEKISTKKRSMVRTVLSWRIFSVFANAKKKSKCQRWGYNWIIYALKNT